MRFILIYITNPTKDEAKKIARHLLEKKLIACANIYPSESMYWWEGKLEDQEEFVIVAKTLDKKFDAVRKEVESMHSYTIPCVIKVPVDSNKQYFDWLKGEVK